MANLTERQKLILALIIREHSKSTQPVGSKSLVDLYDLEYSSATVRNEMSILAENGLIHQPHTSAGRVPTEEGYRYFVSELMGTTELPETTKRNISNQFYQTPDEMEAWLRVAASTLAINAQAASLVTAPQAMQAVFKHLELISLRGRQVLLILVLQGGEVRQQMLTLGEPVDQTKLSKAASRVVKLCMGLDYDQVRSLIPPADPLEADILKLTVDLLESSTSVTLGEVYRDGLTHMLGEPAFADVENARRALRILEERSLLKDLLLQTMGNAEIGVVQVLIGGESDWEELSECSIVLARYGVPNAVTGMLGVLGPIRMPYVQTISTVRFIAELLSDKVAGTHA